MSSTVAPTVVAPPARRAPKPFPLRYHQADAVAAVQPDADRQQVIMACGTGKTVTGPHATKTLLAGRTGTVLVLVPTLTLLQQTFESWSENAPFAFHTIAVCSTLARSEEDIDVSELTLAATTDPSQLAGFIAAAPDSVRVVFSTYQSLGSVIAAHAKHKLPRWDVVLCDEAHRTAGDANKPFARVLHDRHVPADRRLFMTATPRVHRLSGSSTTETLLASMDDQNLYGKRMYTLSVAEAVERGILSQYRVAVIGVEDSELAAAESALAHSPAAGSPRTADHIASIVALSKAARERGLRSVISFFNSIRASKEFVSAFNTVHAALDGGSAEHIDGAMKLTLRREALERLSEDRTGSVHLISNARCLSEGIDVPVLDAVLFGEPRSSQIDVVQCVGRAIRKNPRSEDPALIVLAVRIGAGDDPETAIEEAEFTKVRQVITALADHDPRIAEELRRQVRGGSSGMGQKNPEFRSSLLTLDIPGQLLENGFALRMLDVNDRSYEVGLAAVREFSAENGHARVPASYSSTDGYRLGRWVSARRVDFAAGNLSWGRIAELEEIPGWAWHGRDVRWEDGLSAVRAYAAKNGHARVPSDYITPNGHRTGLWVSNRRAYYSQGKLTADRVAELEKIPGWAWRSFEAKWESGLSAVHTYVANNGHAGIPTAYASPDGHRTGRWVAKRRVEYAAGKLSADRIAELEKIPGWMWRVE
jgi:superfamily II DNA or RNA helicase